MSIRVAIVEDDDAISTEMREALTEDSGCVCVSVSRNFRSAIRKIPEITPDVAIVDINLPDGSGVEIVTRLKRRLPQTQFMMFTVFEDSEQIFKALEAGASGYLLKRATMESLVYSIHEIMAGGVPMTGEVARKVIRHFHHPVTVSDPLTRREEEILQLLAKGMLSREIANTLEISLETVNTHLKHIYGKLHVRSRTEAVIKFLH